MILCRENIAYAGHISHPFITVDPLNEGQSFVCMCNYDLIKICMKGDWHCA